MIKISFREAMDKDLHICAGIIAASEAWTNFGINFDKAVDMLNNMDDKIYVAQSGNDVIGFITLRINGMGNFGAYVRMIAVKKELRNMGIGKKLVEFIEPLAFKYNKNIFLICSPKNSDAINFYKKVGFEEVGLLKDLIMQGHDEILYKKARLDI